MKIRAFEVPYDSGHFQARMGLGPSALMKTGLVSRLRFLGHEVVTDRLRIADEFPSEIKMSFAVARNLSERIARGSEQNSLPVVLSGNCDAALGTIAALNTTRDTVRTGVLWFDAHGEFHTPETTSSGFLDGMGLAIATGYCWRRLAESIPGFTRLSPQNIVLAGARDIDPEEQVLLDSSGVQQIPAGQIHERGIRPLFIPAIAALARRVDCLYIHFDLDVLDPGVARWNQWTPPGGLKVEQVQAALELLAGGPPIAAIGFASHDPAIDSERSYEAARQLVDCTLALAGA